MSVDNKQGLESRARHILDEQIKDMDAALLSRLKQARIKALDAASERHDMRPWWLVGGVIAATVVLSVSLALFRPGPEAGIPEWLQQQDSDVEMLVVMEDPEFYEELEFLLWLDASDHES